MMIELFGVIGGLVSVLLAFFIMLNYARTRKRLAEDTAITRFGFKKSTISYYSTEHFFQDKPLKFYLCALLIFVCLYFVVFVSILKEPFSKYVVVLVFFSFLSIYYFVKKVVKK